MTNLEMLKERAMQKLAVQAAQQDPNAMPPQGAPMEAPPMPPQGAPMGAPPMPPQGAPMGAPPQGGQIPPETMQQMLADPEIIQMLQQMGIQVDPASGQAMDMQTGQPIAPAELEQIFIASMGVASQQQDPNAMPPQGMPPQGAPMGAPPMPKAAGEEDLALKIQELEQEVAELKNQVDNSSNGVTSDGLTTEAQQVADVPPAPPMGTIPPTPMQPQDPNAMQPQGMSVQANEHDLPRYTEKASAVERINKLLHRR